jgi:hypothetical protein
VRLLTVIAVAAMMLPELAAAQRPRQLPAAQRPGRQADTGGRARLEADVRRNFARLVRQQVGLTDDQMRRLVPVTQKYEQQRRQLSMQERDARMSLRDIVMTRQAADTAQVERLLQRLIDVQKRRVELVEAENRELSAFMNPMQRARLFALQEQARRRIEQMRQRRMP